MRHLSRSVLIATALAVAAIAAPAASADPSHSGWNPTPSGWVVRPNPDQQAAQILRGATARPAPSTWVVRPNPDQQAAQLARAAAARSAPTAWVVRPNPDEQVPLTGPSAIVRVAQPGGGFDWGDAGIGAAGGVAISILALGLLLMVSLYRGRRSKRAAAIAS